MFSLRSLANAVVLPIFTVLLTLFTSSPQHLSNERMVKYAATSGGWPGWAWPGWSAVEAIGTILAVIVALGLALYELGKGRRENERQRQSIRALLRLEIESNLRSLESFARRVIGDDSAEVSDLHTDTPQFLRRYAAVPIKLHSETHDCLKEQLGLVSMALAPNEIANMQVFYHYLGQVVQGQQDFKVQWNQEIWPSISAGSRLFDIRSDVEMQRPWSPFDGSSEEQVAEDGHMRRVRREKRESTEMAPEDGISRKEYEDMVAQEFSEHYSERVVAPLVKRLQELYSLGRELVKLLE